MRKLRYILRKEFKQIFRDKMILRLIFVAPAIQLLVLPFAADYEVNNINVGIVDHDHSSISRSIIRKIEFSTYFNLQAYGSSSKEYLNWIEKDIVDLVIEIPANFESTLIREDEASIYMAVNSVNGIKGSIGSSYALNIIREVNNNIRREVLNMPSLDKMSMIDVTYSKWYNKESNYQVFMVPGILAILLTLVGALLSALNIVREKEIGTIEQLNVSPIKKYQFIIGKIIPFWMLGVIILTIGLIISYIVHGIVPGLNIGSLYLFAILYLPVVLGYGLIISNFAETQQQAMMLSFFFMLIFILLSGLFTPIESMPKWAQVIAYINSVTYMVDVTRMILLKGATLFDITQHFKVMLLEAIIFNTIAVYTYKKQN